MENKTSQMKLRMKQKRRKPDFLRQNWFRFPSLGMKWRAPIGKRNKLRKHIKGKGFLPKAGYGSPASVKGMHPSGLMEIRVFNADGLQKINPATGCARIASGVGKKKRMEIIKKAAETKIRVLNPGRVEARQ
ncbi:50S ribosomal protein L32e [archaeon]|nr:MAG: 50S ribosomal protein L32e [archaeon]